MGNPPDALLHLVHRFDQDRKVFLSADYKEEQLRLEFLNPFFSALGWDMDNKQGLSETFKQVIHEESIKVAGASKAPDYTFRIGGRRTFFVEAKKPAVNVAGDSGPAFQLRRYAWTAKLPVSILSDFEEFAVYDCRLRPFKTDKPATARTMLLGYQDYAERWDELAGLFSPDAIQRGALERYVESTKTKKGTATVDDAFLEEISRWRDLLARNIALRNPRLSTRELNFAVQRTIDRLIFLRICEDRGIESYAWLQSLLNGERVYARLLEHFRTADDRYNSGLFHFSDEKGFAEPPDKLSLELAIDDKPLKDIIGNLYYPDSPYEFSVMPADVLGQVYEQFLGKVIRLTAGHQAKVEEKPEVRKAGGVYYTPTYIVDYIVKNTVGRLLEGKTPKQASDLRILDPACGSGSFLLGAYQYLLDWHLDYYTKHRRAVTLSAAKGLRSGAASPVYQDSTGTWKLTTSERKRILLNNIYGVDIDSQAVEVTKLSLLLKVLEGENQETINSQLKLYHERALPDLGSNIKCGNSLIGPDFYQGEQQVLFADEEERLRINTFDWNQAFPDIMNRGGFDAVIGNPPYIDIVGIPPEQRTYFSSAYSTFMYRSDISGVFFERAIALLRDSGAIGFITSNTYFTSSSALKLRRLMLDRLSLGSVIDFGGGVFADAAVDTAVLVATKATPTGKHAVAVVSCKSASEAVDATRSDHPAAGYTVEQGDFARPPDYVFTVATDLPTLRLLRKIDNSSDLTVGTHFEFSRGYIAYDAHRGHSQKMIRDRVFHAPRRMSKEYKKELVGSDIARYALTVESPLWIRFGDNLAAPRDQRFHTGPRVWVQRIRNPSLKQRLVCFYTDEHDELAASSGLTIVRSLEPGYSAAALCGLLNSSLVNWWYRQKFHDVNIKPADMGPIPVPKQWARQQSAMEKLVLQMQLLCARRPKAKTPHEVEALQRQIAATDGQIDMLVYELYGMTEDEIRVVEGGSK